MFLAISKATEENSMNFFQNFIRSIVDFVMKIVSFFKGIGNHDDQNEQVK